MDLKGWEYDCDSLPFWKDRRESHLFELPNADLACLRYYTVDTFARTTRDFCAILSQKRKPVLLLHILEIEISPEACLSRDLRYLILRARYRREKSFLLLLDLAEKKFAVEHVVPIHREYSIEEREDGIFDLLICGQDPTTLESTAENAWLQGSMRRTFSLKAKRWRDWSALSEGRELNLQQRSLFSVFKSRERIWRESVELVRFGMISAQEFVDRNQSKHLYFTSPFVVEKNGKVKAVSIQNEVFAGHYLPAFTTKEACIAYYRAQNWESVALCRATLKRLMRTMDAHYVTHEWGIVINPNGSSLVIPPGVRVTPKSLRY